MGTLYIHSKCSGLYVSKILDNEGLSVSGEMSEKLSRCRKELTAAIDRALEDLSVPFSPSPDNPTNQDCDLSTARPLSPPVADLLGHKGETALPLIYCPQQSLLVSSAPEKENPLLKPNVVPVTTTSHTTTCIKREPLSSKENTWLHPPIFMTDRQFLISLEDGERWRKGQLRYAMSGTGSMFVANDDY